LQPLQLSIEVTAVRREIELKLPVEDPEELREKLRAAGASFDHEHFEIDRLYDTSDRLLFRNGCGFRVRQISRPGVGGKRTLVTFKGPRESSDIKSREEIETGVDDANAFMLILQRLQFREAVVYEKRREIWRWKGCEICLDELPRIGWWMEIEAESDDAVRAASRQLGLSDIRPSQETYVEMAVEHGDRDDDGRASLVFPP
jgi:adenylate cyclase class 2